MMTLKRCICGASKDFPICDGSHSTRKWSCQSTIEQTERLILYTPSLHSLSQWCSHKLSIPTIDSYKETHELQAQTLILLYDGQQLDILEHWLQRIPHQREEWIHIGEQFHSLPVRERHAAIQVTHRRWLLSLPLPKTFHLEDLEEGHPYPIQPRRIFASHAIQDEKDLLPLISELRIRFSQEVFFCANSIETASNWFDEITAAISEAEMVWVFCSEAMKQSTFCAYEIGVASALQKPIVPILLDHSTPPTYLQHLHADSVLRTQQRMPWLSRWETLQHICLRKLQELR